MCEPCIACGSEASAGELCHQCKEHSPGDYCDKHDILYWKNDKGCPMCQLGILPVPLRKGEYDLMENYQ